MKRKKIDSFESFFIFQCYNIIKLKEELDEYFESGSVEELADMMEVMLGILDAKGVSFNDFEELRKEKVSKRGAFKEKIYLEKVE